MIQETFSLPFRAGDYGTVIRDAEAAIAQDSDAAIAYWYLGMALLLDGQTDEAQAAWMEGLMLDVGDADAMSTLLNTLQQEIQVAASQSQIYQAWLLLQCYLEFAPNDHEALLEALEVGLQVGIQTADPEQNLSPGAEVAGVVDHLVALVQGLEEAGQNLTALWTPAQRDRLLQIGTRLMEADPSHPTTLGLTEVCVHAARSADDQAKTFAETLYRTARRCYEQSQFLPAIAFADWSMQLTDPSVDRIANAIAILREGGLATRPRALELAERWLAIAPDRVNQLQALETRLTLLADSAGQDDGVDAAYADYRTLFQAIATESQHLLSTAADPLSELLKQVGNVRQLINAGTLPLYFEDAPAQYRPWRNAIAQAAQCHLQALVPELAHQEPRSRRPGTDRPLKVGYLASTLYRHSVGWLSRWLFIHHSRDRVEVHLYSTTTSPDFVQQALQARYGDRFHAVPPDIGAIASQIAADGIEILVELDSLTSLGNCSVMALKPAPIQVNWLGFDSSGLPAIDYFIADPYVLPQEADSYYQETLWRLPHTYIAVDGFEVHSPTLRREDLNLPTDAVVYLSSQAGLKRNRHNMRVQLEIIKAVPSSYLLVKSLGTRAQELRRFCDQIAEEVGVGCDRLRFLPDVPSEFTHRANLALADVVLDTYPYNGATTTLEALWMGLPMVTRVGQQFAARNSYTMLMNVGVTEGIAWSDAEYIEWGIRLGKDTALRETVILKLRQARRTAPLWNGKQFAQEMETAFEQMWRQR